MGTGSAYTVFLYDKRIRRPRDKHGMTGLTSALSLKIILGAFYVERLQLLDDVLQFLGERAIENFVFAFPIEFQTAAMQKQAIQAELFFDFAVEGEVAVSRIA